MKLIRESVNKHDIVTFQDHTDLTRVVEKGYDAILTAQGENDVEDGYTEGEKDEVTRHLEELIHNGVLTGDWTDSYRKINPDKVLPVDWTALKVKDIQPGARYPQDALVNVQMDNPAVGDHQPERVLREDPPEGDEEKKDRTGGGRGRSGAPGCPGTGTDASGSGV